MLRCLAALNHCSQGQSTCIGSSFDFYFFSRNEFVRSYRNLYSWLEFLQKKPNTQDASLQNKRGRVLGPIFCGYFQKRKQPPSCPAVVQLLELRFQVMVQSKPNGVEELKFRAVEAMGLRAKEEAVRRSRSSWKCSTRGLVCESQDHFPPFCLSTKPPVEAGKRYVL